MKKIDQQPNHHFVAEIVIDAPLARTWEVLTNVADWPKWDTELKKAELHGAFEDGSTGTMWPKTGPKLSFYLKDIIENESYTVITNMPVGNLEMRRFLHGADGKTIFIDDIRFNGLMKYIFGLLLGRQFKKALPAVMQTFKQLAEQ